MRAQALILFALTNLGLVGCAEVHPQSAVAPTGVLAGPGAVDQDGNPVTVVDGVESAGFDGANATQDGADGDTDAEELEDDHEDGEGADFTACLDRGPSKPPHCPQFSWKSPIEGLSAAEIEHKVKFDLASIGPISVGAPNAGRLFNGVQMPESDRWKMTDPGDAYGTQETVDSITRAVDKVFTKYPDSPKLIIGHISAKGGGRLKPHRSHQAGRDVDLSYFYTKNVGWYAYATEENLDKARTWTFVKAFLEDPNTEMVLIDTSIQRMLYEYAKEQGEDKAFLDRVFQIANKNPAAIIRHVRGHATHIHVRFFSPSAQMSGRLAQAYLPKPPPPPKRTKGKHYAKGKDDPSETNAKKAKNGEAAKKAPKEEEAYVFHRARSGDTLDSLARRYGVSVQSIRQANGLKSSALKEKKTYRIPKPDHPVASSASPGSGKRRR